MADVTNAEIKSPEAKAPELTRDEIIKAYFDAGDDRPKRAALFAQYPVLKTIFSEGNHS